MTVVHMQLHLLGMASMKSTHSANTQLRHSSPSLVTCSQRNLQRQMASARQVDLQVPQAQPCMPYMAQSRLARPLTATSSDSCSPTLRHTASAPAQFLSHNLLEHLTEHAEQASIPASSTSTCPWKHCIKSQPRISNLLYGNHQAG